MACEADGGLDPSSSCQKVAAMVEPAINKVLWVSFTSRTAPGSTDGSVASILQQGLEVRYKK